MHKIFSFSTLPNHLTNILKNDKFLTPTSHFHTHIKSHDPDSKLGFILNEVEELQLSKPKPQIAHSVSETEALSDRRTQGDDSTVQISHPWSEWVELMERLLKRGYFESDPVRDGEMGAKDSNRIRTSCLNFARDRFDIMRYFSRKDIMVVVGSGCPSIDRKVVNSGKRLRAHVGIAEGNVCSSCSLRGDCDRAYVKARVDEEGRTVDVMRILLTYGLDPIIGSVENKSCQNKTAKESVRRLLKQMVELSSKQVDANISKSTHVRQNISVQEPSTPQEKSHIDVPMKQGDWICPKCNFMNFARNIRCLRCDGLFKERLKMLGENQDHLPLKKGDWLCDNCNFLNFAKNTRCLQCKENPPKRHINPGEWECDSCNYINFRKNTICLKCDYRRPKAKNIPDSAQPRHENEGNGANDQRSDRFAIHRGSPANMWRFVEGENYDDNDGDSKSSYSEKSGFVDFPIKGGNTNLSRNKQKRERWKAQMADCHRQSTKEMENADEFKSGCLKRRSEFLESSDDEELAEWFGHGQKSEK